MRYPLLVVSRDFSVSFYLHCFAAPKPKTAHATVRLSYFVYSYEVTNMLEANNVLGAPRINPAIARQMLLGMLAATIARIEDHGGRRIEPNAKRPVVAHVGPEPPALGFRSWPAPAGVFVSACLVLDAST